MRSIAELMMLIAAGNRRGGVDLREVQLVEYPRGAARSAHVTDVFRMEL